MKYTPLLVACSLVIGGCSGNSSNDSGGDTNTDPGIGSQIDVDNYEELLRAVVSATNVTSLQANVERVRTFDSELESIGNVVRGGGASSRGLTFAAEETFDGGIRQSYTCDAGGSLVLSLHDDPLRHQFESDSCFVGTDLYDGGYDFTGGREDGSIAFNAFSATFPDGSSFSIDGDFARYDGATGSDRTKSWTDADYVSRDTTGAETRLSSLLRTRERAVTQPSVGFLGDNAGYVTLDDGSVALAVPYDDKESLVSGFTLVTPTTGDQGLEVSANLSLEDSYYGWFNQNVEERSGFVVPEYPVIDLGSALTFEQLDTGASLSVEQTAQRGENAQWDSGSLLVTAPDGSHVALSPSASDPSMVEIRVNDADAPILRERADGFQVSCPGQFDTCG